MGILPNEQATRVPAQGRLLGEPVGLWFLAFTEAWERFSYYGMTGILVLYMQQSLLLPGHVGHIAGFGGFRATLEGVFGPMSTMALASQIYGLYAGFMYFTPMFGGMIADRLIGRRAAVMTGALLMSAGHVAMAFDQSFLLALALLVVGCGLLKGNISAQVGQFYPVEDADGRTRGFAIFSVGINVGAVVGPLACGLLAQVYGWHAGFGAAGLLMLIGLATYMAGFRFMPTQAKGVRESHAPLTAADWRKLALLILVIVLTCFQSVIYYQNTDAALVWIDGHVDLDFFGFHVPVAWFNSIDPFTSIVLVPPLLAWWKRQNERGREPSELAKIATGVWIAVAANIVLLIAALGGGRAPVIAPIMYDVLLGIGFLYYWPTLLALVSRVAPPKVNSTMMGVVFLSLFVSYNIIGWLGGFYGRMTPTEFWAMNVAIGVAGALLLMLLRRPIERGLELG
ncbi:peptide MFS transporter [Sphingomonas nostoxanthinifaciens]|uniref:peptide MFS transporter n=1 Tax=Sphingomonas nostoxanthinifaciens TaxID=2872652 RepID=UPI001CC1FB24|nr:peptide MFS transporter [Sphingomonas nostoxanthinifaciens]UAK23447.1 peptide MFS transporter [Sphingomonas nostoxanthinifaciens]